MNFSASGEVELEGPSHQIAQAQQEIVQRIPVVETYEVEKSLFGRIIGRGGQTIGDLRKKHQNASIVLKSTEGVIVITGMKSDCDGAWNEIRRIISTPKY